MGMPGIRSLRGGYTGGGYTKKVHPIPCTPTPVLTSSGGYRSRRYAFYWNNLLFMHTWSIHANYFIIFILVLYLPPANEVWGKVIFSVACVKNSVHRGRGFASVHAGIPPHPPSRHPPPEQAPTPGEVHAGRYGQQAGGMHPLLECNLVSYATPQPIPSSIWTRLVVKI